MMHPLYRQRLKYRIREFLSLFWAVFIGSGIIMLCFKIWGILLDVPILGG